MPQNEKIPSPPRGFTILHIINRRKIIRVFFAILMRCWIDIKLLKSVHHEPSEETEPYVPRRSCAPCRNPSANEGKHLCHPKESQPKEISS